jgi:hypothetical protein
LGNQPLVFSREYRALIELEDFRRRINGLRTSFLDGFLGLETACNVMKSFNRIS